MDTISHGLWAYVIFRNHPAILQFILGSIFVDIPLIIAGLWIIIGEGGIPDKLPILVMDAGFLSTIAFAFHSAVVWGAALTASLLFFKRGVFFVLGWGFHIAIDVITQVNDSFPIFWPLSDRVTRGIVSYWEPEYHSITFNIVQISLLVIFFSFLYLRRRTRRC